MSEQQIKEAEEKLKAIQEEEDDLFTLQKDFNCPIEE